MRTATVSVDGMSCQHCVNAVTEQISGLPGVHDVTVDLDHGEVTITSDAALPVTDLDRAVTEAGYTLRT